jgi:8-oxo-dGTP diphosphatase
MARLINTAAAPESGCTASSAVVCRTSEDTSDKRMCLPLRRMHRRRRSPGPRVSRWSPWARPACGGVSGDSGGRRRGRPAISARFAGSSDNSSTVPEPDSIPVFGHAADGYRIVPRPSAYAVAVDSRERVAIVRTPEGTFLPGGGIEHGETAEDAVVRETLEECGFVVDAGKPIGCAREIVWSVHDRHYVAKESQFFHVSVRGYGRRTEEDHELLWATAGEALDRLSHGSHKWAVTRALGADHVNQSAGRWARLDNDAYELAERHRDDTLTRPAAIRELEARHPGLSVEEYERAFSDGLFASR